ncbi:Appr-1-p processing protein [Streptomyces antimycoticus]
MKPPAIRYTVGDATAPPGTGPRIIAHVCNDFALGAVRLVPVNENLWVANMIGQHGIRRAGGRPPIRYEAIEEALGRLAEYTVNLKASVHMPRIGAGLAGGDWSRIEPLIEKQLCEQGVDVTVYDLPST